MTYSKTIYSLEASIKLAKELPAGMPLFLPKFLSNKKDYLARILPNTTIIFGGRTVEV